MSVKRDEPEVVNNRWEEDPVILGAILDIQSAIRRISKFGSNRDIADAVAELEQAVNWLKGKE